MARFSALAFLALFTSVATAFVTPVAPHFRSRSVSATSSTTRMSAAPVAPPTVSKLKAAATFAPFGARVTERQFNEVRVI